nr:pentatricopeptide repeat-containing protein At4g19220, mitochondrial-like [Quercus suber]POF22968.1 pentatricopeptide repeat-containing protein, mitochondrial [Quercus suber]
MRAGWAVKAKIRGTVEQISNTSLALLLRLSSSASFALFHHFRFHSYNVLIPKTSPLFHSSNFSTALQLFDEMSQRDRHAHDNRFYHALHLVKSCTVRPNIVNASIGHCIALKIGGLAHLPNSTSLLTVYSRARHFGSSFALFDEIHNRDVVIWNAMITASVENGYFSAAMKLFVAMTEEGTGFDSTTLLVVVSASSHANHLKQGKVIHGLSLKSGLLFDSILCNALLDMYSKCGDLSS